MPDTSLRRLTGHAIEWSNRYEGSSSSSQRPLIDMSWRAEKRIDLDVKDCMRPKRIS